MRTQRPLTFLIACLLAVSLVFGTALPSPALWQCHHAARVVAASFAAAPAAMPCRMGGTMAAAAGTMSCCPAPRVLKLHGASPRQATGRPGCNPILSLLAAQPAVQSHETHLRQCLVLALTACSAPAPVSFPVPFTLTQWQRPPPGGAFQSTALSFPSLRAPPHAA